MAGKPVWNAMQWNSEGSVWHLSSAISWKSLLIVRDERWVTSHLPGSLVSRHDCTIKHPAFALSLAIYSTRQCKSMTFQSMELEKSSGNWFLCKCPWPHPREEFQEYHWKPLGHFAVWYHKFYVYDLAVHACRSFKSHFFWVEPRCKIHFCIWLRWGLDKQIAHERNKGKHLMFVGSLERLLFGKRSGGRLALAINAAKRIIR